MPLHPQAGQPAKPEQLVDLVQLEQAYYSATPDPSDPQQRVSFGTSGHRGSSLRHSFNEAHILAITQAICEYRQSAGTTGPLFIGKDTHALSEPAQRTALEVLAANQVHARMDQNDGYTPTPVMSHAILTFNRGRTSGLADGIIITPSHNPPEDGGIKYNPPHGGPADTDVTKVIENRANELLTAKLRSVKRVSHEQALKASSTERHDFVGTYLADLINVVDLDRIKAAKLRLAVDPLGGAAVAYWRPLAERYGLDIQIVNEKVDPTFGFMTLDWDGKIRMDCSSPYAMASLIKLKDRFDLAFGNDTDTDRHGIVTPGAGLMNPNHYLASAIAYLFTHRPGWKATAGIGNHAPLPGADYLVPAGPDTPEQRYPIEPPMVEVSGSEFRIDYKLPQLLVGDDQSISLRGTLDGQRRIATVSGDAGTASCDLMPGGGLTLRCDELLTGISVNLDAVGEMARTTDPTRAPSLIAIARRFASEPIGILEVR